MKGIEGLRLDFFVAEQLKERYTRGHVKRLIERGDVTVDGVVKDPSYRLKGGENVRLKPTEPVWTEKLDDFVVHEDSQLLVLDKPARLLMHPLGDSWLNSPEAALAEPHANLAGILQRDRKGQSKVTRCGIVHRLDRQTSGILLVAKTDDAYETLIDAFKERDISKTYRAIVRGVPKRKDTRVDAPIGRNPGHRQVTVTPFGKDAETDFKVLEEGPAEALVQARPRTGRTHQIRAHLAFMGHPVAGDPEFDKSPGQAAPRTMLHAWKIELSHPATGKPVSFTAPVPKDFRDYWKSLKERE